MLPLGLLFPPAIPVFWDGADAGAGFLGRVASRTAGRTLHARSGRYAVIEHSFAVQDREEGKGKGGSTLGASLGPKPAPLRAQGDGKAHRRRIKHGPGGRRKRKVKLVRLEGFEPPTNGFGSHYSIRLSYRRPVDYCP